MRHRKVSSSSGTVNRRLRFDGQLLVLAAIVVVVLWMLWSFGQEVLLSHRLSRQAAQLRQENAALQVTNNGYRRDIAASSSGAAAEEEARQNGYSKKDERQFLISAPPPAKATARPSPAASHGAAGGHQAAAARHGPAPPNPLQRFWHWLTRASSG